MRRSAGFAIGLALLVPGGARGAGQAPASARSVTPAAASAASSPPRRKGVALGLFTEDPGWSYGGLLDEIAALGANEVELVVPWYQMNGASTEIRLHPRFSPPDQAVARAIDDAHSRGLRVLLLPIIRLEAARGDEWRGKLAPANRAAWFASYRARLLALATLASAHRAEGLVIGSELSTLDVDPTPWRPLVGALRARFHGELVYSANWDHYPDVAIFPLVDEIGLSGYFPLGDAAHDDEDVLVSAWQSRRRAIDAFLSARHRSSFLFTEIGYLSQRDSHARPFDEGATEPLDLAEQARCYRAFVRAWSSAAELDGLFFWNWYGFGGPTSGGYTPRGKPAADRIAGWYGGMAPSAPGR